MRNVFPYIILNIIKVTSILRIGFGWKVQIKIENVEYVLLSNTAGSAQAHFSGHTLIHFQFPLLLLKPFKTVITDQNIRFVERDRTRNV